MQFVGDEKLTKLTKNLNFLKYISLNLCVILYYAASIFEKLMKSLKLFLSFNPFFNLNLSRLKVFSLENGLFSEANVKSL